LEAYTKAILNIQISPNHKNKVTFIPQPEKVLFVKVTLILQSEHFANFVEIRTVIF